MEINTNLYRVFVGLNDQVTKRQEIATDDALRMASEYLASHFEGATVFNGIGVYKHNDGTVVRENSLIIELVYVSDEDVNQMINEFRVVFNQESVMKVTIPCNCGFIG